MFFHRTLLPSRICQNDFCEIYDLIYKNGFQEGGHVYIVCELLKIIIKCCKKWYAMEIN